MGDTPNDKKRQLEDGTGEERETKKVKHSQEKQGTSSEKTQTGPTGNATVSPPSLTFSTASPPRISHADPKNFIGRGPSQPYGQNTPILTGNSPMFPVQHSSPTTSSSSSSSSTSSTTTINDSDDELMRRPMVEILDNADLSQHWIHVRQTCVKTIEGQLKPFHPFDTADVANNIVLLVGNFLTLANAIDEGSLNIDAWSGRISLTIHGRENAEALRGITEKWVKWEEVKDIIAAPTGDIPLFGLPAKQRYNDAQLKQAIQRRTKDIELAKIAYVSFKENLTTIFCADIETAFKIANLDWFPINNGGNQDFSNRFIIQAGITATMTQTKIGPFISAPTPAMIIPLFNAKLKAANTTTRINTVSILRNQSRAFIGSILLNSTTVDDKFQEAVQGYLTKGIENLRIMEPKKKKDAQTPTSTSGKAPLGNNTQPPPPN